VEAHVATLPPGRYANIHCVAEAMRMSIRTLQRCLHEEGTTFRRVVARARVSAAQRLLDDPARKIVDVALDLGYSDQAHFTRAFVRWIGVTPREFRRRSHGGEDVGISNQPLTPYVSVELK
jgi:AraC-like DNA-binding protein